MKKFIGNKDFYKLVAALALPLLLSKAIKLCLECVGIG